MFTTQHCLNFLLFRKKESVKVYSTSPRWQPLGPREGDLKRVVTRGEKPCNPPQHLKNAFTRRRLTPGTLLVTRQLQVLNNVSVAQIRFEKRPDVDGLRVDDRHQVAPRRVSNFRKTLGRRTGARKRGRQIFSNRLYQPKAFPSLH